VTVAGTWENEYGSRMTLAAEGSAVSGSYASTTGSTGRYVVLGRQANIEPTAEAGQPVALAISWHSIRDDPADASWEWVSSLGGQVSLIGGEEILILNHLLIATKAFPGVCKQGIYIDKLTYRRVRAEAPPDMQNSAVAEEVTHPLVGAWSADDGAALELSVKSAACRRFGVVSGTLREGPRAFDIAGLTNLVAKDGGTSHQAVAIVTADLMESKAVSLGGWIVRETGALTVQAATHYSTAHDSTYLQSAVRPLLLIRTDKK
jgi:saccharopepsin